MKKVLFTAGLVLLGLGASAQWTKGSKMMTGNLNYQSNSTSADMSGTKTDLYKNSGFGINLSGGYFLKDNIAVGVTLGYGSANSEDIANDIQGKSSAMNYGVFGRYYKSYNNNFSMFAQLNFAMSSSSNTQTSGGVDLESTGSGMDAGLGLGMNYFVTNNIFLEANYGFLGYNTNTWGDDTYSYTDSGIGFNFDLNNIWLGMGVKF